MLSFIADLMIVVYCGFMLLGILFMVYYTIASGESANPDKRIEAKLDKLLAHFENENENVEKKDDVTNES